MIYMDKIKIDYLSMLHMPGVVSDNERVLLRELTQDAVGRFGPEPTIVNIGIARGGSCYYLRSGALSAKLFGIDICGDDHLFGNQDEKDALNLNIIRGSSTDVHKHFGEPIHVLFIDGCHHYEVVSQDIINWCSKVLIGGSVAFHDAVVGKMQSKWCDGVSKAIDDKLGETGCWVEESPVDMIRWFVREM